MKRFFALALAMILILALCACGSAAPAASSSSDSSSSAPAAEQTEQAPAAPDKVYEIKLVTSNGPTDVDTLGWIKAAEVIKERTNGGVDIQVYPSGEILMGDEGIEALVSDAAVITVNDLDTEMDYVPELETLCASFLWGSAKQMEDFTGTDVWNEIMAKADAANFHFICTDFYMGSRNIFAGHGTEIRSVADCSKLNIRCPNSSAYVNAFNLMGANYSSVSWSEGITACETGMLDGAECTVQRAATCGLAQILEDPVYSVVKWRCAPVGLCIGYGYWMSLPEEYRTIITEEFENCAHECNAQIEADEAGYLDSLVEQGVTIVPYEEVDVKSFQDVFMEYNSTLPMWDEIYATAQSVA